MSIWSFIKLDVHNFLVLLFGIQCGVIVVQLILIMITYQKYMIIWKIKNKLNINMFDFIKNKK